MPVRVDDGLAVLAKRLANVSRDADKDFRQAVGSMKRAAGTETKRATTAIYNVNQGRVGDDVRVTSDANSVTVTGRKKEISLLSYGFKPTAAGLRGAVLKGKSSVIKSAFVATGLSGNKLPFRREGDKRKMTRGRYAGKRRSPVKVKYGPSVADMLAREIVQETLKTQVIGRAAQELRRRIARALSG